MRPIYQESVTVIASDLANTAWAELYELWQRAAVNKENPALTAEFARLTTKTKELHDEILALAKFYPPEV